MCRTEIRMKSIRSYGRSIPWYEKRTLLPLISTSTLYQTRFISSRPIIPKMADYNKWTKDDLIKRVKALENELKSHEAAQPIPAATSEPATLKKHQEDASTHNAAAAAAVTSSGEPIQKKQKKAKSMDPSKYATRFIALKIAYIGKKYNGFEYQSSGLMSTIEEELWKALVKSCLIFPDPERPNEVDWNVCEYSKCGRTDRGVSAFGQVIALRVRSNKLAKRKPVAIAQEEEGQKNETVPKEEGQKEEEELDNDDTPLPVEQEIQYCRMLNRILPPDIKVYAWCPNPGPEFSARFSCRERQYRYFFTQPAFSPMPNFLENPSGSSRTTAAGGAKPKDGWLDIDAMRQAAKLFEGLHDFRNFCKVDPSKQITNFVRRVYEADIVEVDGVDTSIPYLTGPQFRDPKIVASQQSGQDEGQEQQKQKQLERYPKVYYFHVRGSAFLWHQIRCMVAVLFLVGQGLEKPTIITELLDVIKNPRRPNYVLADDAPLVLWDCIFGRENAEGAADNLDWLYVGGEGDGPLNLHGTAGIAGDLWEFWREKKMDEVLANQLVDWISQKVDIERVPNGDAIPADIKGKLARSTRVFEGGNGPKLSGQYVPVSKKECIQSPEVLNDRWAQRKGFKDAEEMRAQGNWREVIRAAKNEEAMDTGE